MDELGCWTNEVEKIVTIIHISKIAYSGTTMTNFKNIKKPQSFKLYNAKRSVYKQITGWQGQSSQTDLMHKIEEF